MRYTIKKKKEVEGEEMEEKGEHEKRKEKEEKKKEVIRDLASLVYIIVFYLKKIIRSNLSLNMSKCDTKFSIPRAEIHQGYRVSSFYRRL